MLYRVIRFIFVIVFSTLYRWDVRGREHLPTAGAAILCANHISWFDPPLVGAASPRSARFMAKEELFAIPVMGWVLRHIDVFPVKRNSADRKAIKISLDTLAEGKLLAMFPEGTRSRTNELLPPQAGVGLIAVKSEAPVIPMAIVGPYKLFKPIKVRIGSPLTFPHLYGAKVKSEDLEQAAHDIMAAIARLREE